MQTVLYSAGLLVATFLWGYTFYKKENHPQPGWMLIQIFGVGLFSMLPVFGYKTIYQNVLPRLAEYEIFRPLLTNPFLIGLFYFGFNVLMLYTILFALSGALTLILTFFKHETLANIRQSLREESFDFIGVSMIIGLLIYGEAFLQKVTGAQIIQATLGSILFLAVIEEFIKHLIVRMVDDKKLQNIDNAITLSVIVGLAFAFIETIIYTFSLGDASLIVYRIFLSLPVHMIASGIFGYYYGLAHFAKPITDADKAEAAQASWLAKILKCKRSTAYAEGKVTEGLFFATLFHVCANLLFEVSLAFLVVPLVVAGLLMINRLYKSGQIEWRLIHRRS